MFWGQVHHLGKIAHMGIGMDRRRLLTCFLALGMTRPASAQSQNASFPSRATQPERKAAERTTLLTLKHSGPITSQFDGQIIENFDIVSNSGHAISVAHNRVTIRNCRIRHAGGHGVHADGSTGLVLESLEIDHAAAPPRGAGPDESRNNIHLVRCPGAVLSRIKASRGASNIRIEESAGSHVSFVELYDARGPFPRGQNVQFSESPSSVLEDFSGENGPTSWTEDNISVFRSDKCVIRRGLALYNNSPTGFGVMLEGSFACVVEDVDAVQQGNGAFAAVPSDDVGSGGCRFHRCRTRDTYNSMRDIRDAPTSNSLSIYTLRSEKAEKHTVTECSYHNLANPNNLIWDLNAVKTGWSFTARKFVPRSPIRLRFGWENSAGE
jgi:hypothetical protein